MCLITMKHEASYIWIVFLTDNESKQLETASSSFVYCLNEIL